MKRTLLAALAVIFIGTMAGGPAMAGKKSQSSISGTIAIETSLRVTDGAQLARYGDSVRFATSVEGRTARNSRVYVLVVCTQDGDVVYQASEDPGTEFVLADQTGQGLEWNGSAAECGGYLVYFEDRREDFILYLDEVSFGVDGVS